MIDLFPNLFIAGILLHKNLKSTSTSLILQVVTEFWYNKRNMRFWLLAYLDSNLYIFFPCYQSRGLHYICCYMLSFHHSIHRSSMHLCCWDSFGFCIGKLSQMSMVLHKLLSCTTRETQTIFWAQKVAKSVLQSTIFGLGRCGQKSSLAVGRNPSKTTIHFEHCEVTVFVLEVGGGERGIWEQI